MELKKGLYFTIDSIVAGGIILTAILLASSFYVKDSPNIRLNYLSQDLITVLASTNVKDINNPYINSLISDGTITNTDNTVLEQIGEFWAEDEMVLANKIASNVTEPWVPNAFGFGIWINNEVIYKRNMPIKKSLVSSKKMISGVKKGQTSLQTRQSPPTLWDPAIVEVRLWD